MSVSRSDATGPSSARPADVFRNTADAERTRRSMIGHSSIIRAPSMRIVSAAIGWKCSVS